MSVEERVLAVITDLGNGYVCQKTPDESFEDLGLDSLDVMTVIIGVEQDFKIDLPDERVRSITTIRDLAGLVEEQLPNAKARAAK